MYSPKHFPRVDLSSTASAADQFSAIDFINRVNWLFETWDVDAMVEAFLPDGAAYHVHGEIRGHSAMRAFYEGYYAHLIPGVSRHATNHIVDADGEGVVVRYQNLLIRYAMPNNAHAICNGQSIESDGSLPAIGIYSPMLDRLRRTAAGWRIAERHLGGAMIDPTVDGGLASAAEAMAYLPAFEGRPPPDVSET